MARKSQYTPEQKAKIVGESNSSPLEEVAKKHGISVATLSIWRRGKKAKKKAGKRKTAKRKASKKRGGKRRVAKRAARIEGFNIESLADDLQLAAMIKGFLKQLGYVKR